ncbi:MAG: FKBP-type peptidyl-prolyl cis-trans isomerase [Eggerthellaceae bacterium]|nr:FKBP-type peptidyl-prolyl cis-trans isomerase [Eggerthellaceae bacterium]
MRKKIVFFQYKGSLPDGTVFDDCNGEAHHIIIGRRQVMRVLEDALDQMEVGEERTLEIAAADAYGEYDWDAVQKVPTFKIPNGANMPVGETIAWTTPRSSKPIPARVLEIENQVATLDFNHPLAGKDIIYWVKVTAIEIQE